MHPRGPLPPAVYWRRRAITVGGVLIALVILARSCGGGDGSTLTSSTGGSPSPSPAVTSAKPIATPSAAPPAPSPTPARAAGQPCRDTDLQVMATANAKEYAAGARPRLSLVVTNLASVSCTRDLGAAARELRVVSGTDRVWSSDDCAPGGAADVVLLEPGRSRSYPVTWSRTRSKPGCAGTRAPAAPGTYRVIGRIGSIERPGDVFSLRG